MRSTGRRSTRGFQCRYLPIKPVDLDQRFSFALDLIKEAGDQAHAYFLDLATLTIKIKGVHDLATRAW